MKAITLHQIWVISLKIDPMCLLKLHFSRPASRFIVHAFRRGAAARIGRQTAGFCIWLRMTFPWSAALLSAVFLADLGVVAE